MCFLITNTDATPNLDVYAISGISNSASGTGVNGHSDFGQGVLGATFTGIGVYGHSAGNGLYGVLGDNVGGIGVEGSSTGNVGVYGTTSATSPKSGVYGTSTTASGGIGVKGTVNGSNTAIGVMGTTDIGYGVMGTASSGWGVHGFASGTNGTAVNAVASGSSGRAVNATCNGSCTTGGGYAGYFTGNAVVTGTLTATVVPPSDARLKKDVASVRYGLDQLLRLRPVSYKWKDKASGEGTQIGLIAQEVREVVPEVVRADPASGMLGVNYNALLPVAIKAIQDQQAVIARLEARVRSLESRRGTEPSSRSLGGAPAGSMALGLAFLGALAFVRRPRRPQG